MEELPGLLGQLFFISMGRVALHTLGCKLNFAETSTIARQFEARGFDVVGIDQRADVCVINTCSVTERADRECRQMVRRALRHSPDAYVVVLGCYAQLRPEEIAGIPGVDLVLGTADKFSIFDYAGDFSKLGCVQTHVTPVDGLTSFQGASSLGSGDRTRAFLKVQDGCDYSCSFCTIPLARGASRSTEPTAIIEEARRAVENGYQEVVLTGVNVGDYGRKIGSSLLRLLEGLSSLEGLARIRVSSIEPNLLTNELISFWADNPRLCKHFHVPLQAGNDAILQSMRRRYVTSLYADRIATIRKHLPDAGIGADVITGFPGETDKLFDQTCVFLSELPISYVHAFTYSGRPNTNADALPQQVEPRIRYKRNEILRNLGARKRLAFHESQLGLEREVLIEEKNGEGQWTGWTGEYVRVSLESKKDIKNLIVRVRITHAEGEICHGQLVDTSMLQDGKVTIHNQNEVKLCA